MAETLIGVFLETVKRRGSRTVFSRRGPDGWESIGADRALADVEALGLALSSLGLARGDRVAMLSENRYEWPLTDLAAQGIGAILVPIYPTLTSEQVRGILDNCGARMLVLSSAAQLAKVRPVLASLPALQTLLVMDDTPLEAPRERPFVELQRAGEELRRRDPQAFRTRASEVKPEDVATIIYTSGTTGEPKGAMLTHANIISNVDACLEMVNFGPTDVTLSFLPLCHIFERMAGLYAMLRAGATIAYARNPESVPVDVVEVKPTMICGVPRFYEKVHARVLESVAKRSKPEQALFRWGLAQGLRRARAHFAGREIDDLALRLADLLVMRKVRARMGGRLRMCISGSAALAPETIDFFFGIGIPVLEGYGLTETSPVIALNPPGRERPGSVGKPVQGVEVRIGEQGEILTRGPHVMRGYYRNDEATRVAIRDGWFHTGDVGRFDDDGYLYITDRLKDLLVLAVGKKVAPQPIEAQLKKSPIVSEAVLLGDKHPYVVCLISPNVAALEEIAKEKGWTWRTRAELMALPEVRALYDAEITALNATLAPFEKIRRFALLDEEWSQENGTLTATLKVKRRVVAARYAALIESLYEGHAAPKGA
jgi:long-chain acyl-CoA synthetase